MVNINVDMNFDIFGLKNIAILFNVLISISKAVKKATLFWFKA